MIRIIEKLIYKIIYNKREIIKKKYNRVLPINELWSDRHEKAQYLNCGKNTTVYDSAHIFGEVKIGSNTWIGPYTILDGSGGLEIGSNCSISTGVQIYSHDSVDWAISGGKDEYKYAKTIIGDNCYVAPNVIIAKGVQLAEETIVGANSFVNKSFPKGSKIAGSPAKIISNK